MWSTHPANRDREDNAKTIYIPADIDDRSAWLIFTDPTSIREKISLSFYNAEKLAELEKVSPEEAVVQRFSKVSYSSAYRGAYLNRSPVRNFSSFKEMIQTANLTGTVNTAIAGLYPESIADELELARNLDLERDTLKALASGDLKPSGGVIRHRGDEIKKTDIPDALEEIANERRTVAAKLMLHDANCRKAHLAAAKHYGQDWVDYLSHIIQLLHCSEHLSAVVDNEQSLLVNTWQVITADGQIGYFEKRRMITVCENVQDQMRSLSNSLQQIDLPAAITTVTGIDNWKEQVPLFDIADVDKKNWGDWCQAASQMMSNISYALNVVRAAALEELIDTEAAIANHVKQRSQPEAAPKPGKCPTEYPILLPGDEHILQRKLDLWNRFQLAHGFMPTMMRLLVSFGIVGGTIYAGLAGF